LFALRVCFRPGPPLKNRHDGSRDAGNRRGVTGLATAAALGPNADVVVLEADSEVGGYCKTIKKEGFVWDYSGHFFHFKNPDIEAWLKARMPGQDVRSVAKRSFISYAGRQIDFPFQKNIHQLPQDEFIECLVDLYFARTPGGEISCSEDNFKQMLYARFRPCDRRKISDSL
jgi:protoporphyrinogen oxidase